MRLTRLRVAGFKSFVEPTEFAIEPGLTGLVGPNGCGKSNLVEALRWVMGESSARQMRGGEMDDVIFGGTSTRPARSIAEVTLSLENSDRRAPPPFHDQMTLDVTRRIDRGEGSSYRINGKEVRARDVQVLFADAATGAHSPSLVGQGRIARLIAAKPSERRSILEDAAGIAGLQARRHEAELRLKAAEANLARVDDVRQTMDKTRQGLARQARQAAKYRVFGESIRAAEALLIALAWRKAIAAREVAGAELRAAEAEVARTAALAAAAATLRTDRTTRLPGLRAAAAEAAQAESAAGFALAELEAETRRIDEQLRSLAQQQAQIAGDRDRADRNHADALGAIARLETEAAEIAAAREGEAETGVLAADRLRECEAAATSLEASLSEARQKLAADDAQRGALARSAEELVRRRQRLNQDRAALAERSAQWRRERDALPDPAVATAASAKAEADSQAARAAFEQAQTSRRAAAAAVQPARQAEQTAASALGRLTAEAQGLDAVLAGGAKTAARDPLIDQVQVSPGREAALAAALGEGLSAGLGADPRAPTQWVKLPPISQALPDGAEPLSRHVTAPAALDRSLSQIGLIEDAAQAASIQPALLPGQSLVSPAGDVWRWDGLIALAGAPSAAAVGLRQRNRRRALIEEIAAAEQVVADHRAARVQAERVASEAEAAEASAQRAEREASQTASRLREAASRAAAQAEAMAARGASFEEQGQRLDRDAADLDRAEAELAERRAGLAEAGPAKAAAEALALRLAEQRRAVADARAAFDRLTRDAEARSRRLSALAEEQTRWAARLADFTGQIEALAARSESLEADRQALSQRPARLAVDRDRLIAQRSDLAAAARAAGDALVLAERDLAEADAALRAADQVAAQSREAKLLAETRAQQAVGRVHEVAERMRSRLGCHPAEVDEVAGLDPDAPLPDADAVAAKHDQLIRERDALGPVNLTAESELAAIETQIAELDAEQQDLTQAIHRLRGAIGALNREGRERLQNSFEIVDGHFRQLFEKLFGGGAARLELTEAEDPLNAGLEILASPPGKKLQSLSLMSGGEQALTALALIVAVFLTNPSPICVLDEVDAPLDDANVDRFCDLLGDISTRTGTRFLVVTHHRLTMARMDRLYGVTMSEKGVSRLVSVDLARAERLRVA